MKEKKMQAAKKEAENQAKIAEIEQKTAQHLGVKGAVEVKKPVATVVKKAPVVK